MIKPLVFFVLLSPGHVSAGAFNWFWSQPAYRSFKDCSVRQGSADRDSVYRHCEAYIKTPDDECDAARFFYPGGPHPECQFSLPKDMCDAPVCD